MSTVGRFPGKIRGVGPKNQTRHIKGQKLYLKGLLWNRIGCPHSFKTFSIYLPRKVGSKADK